MKSDFLNEIRYPKNMPEKLLQEYRPMIDMYHEESRSEIYNNIQRGQIVTLTRPNEETQTEPPFLHLVSLELGMKFLEEDGMPYSDDIVAIINDPSRKKERERKGIFDAHGFHRIKWSSYKDFKEITQEMLDSRKTYATFGFDPFASLLPIGGAIENYYN